MNHSRGSRLQRALIGITGIVLILVACYLLLINDGQNTSLSGILIRIGLMLGAVWLAYPVLQLEDGPKSLVWFLVLFGSLFLVAARPRIFVVVLLIGIAALGINWILRQLGQSDSTRK